LFGDSLVPIASATYRGIAHELLPEDRVHVLPGLSHIALSHHPLVYTHIKAAMEQPS